MFMGRGTAQIAPPERRPSLLPVLTHGGGSYSTIRGRSRNQRVGSGAGGSILVVAAGPHELVEPARFAALHVVLVEELEPAVVELVEELVPGHARQLLIGAAV